MKASVVLDMFKTFIRSKKSVVQLLKNERCFIIIILMFSSALLVALALQPLESILLEKPLISIGNHTIQDSEFVRWSSAFHHVFVFTVKKKCVLFIYITKYTL